MLALPLFLISGLLSAQSSYQVTTYNKATYHGGNQNWDIATDDAGNVYVANNSGLIKYDGASWSLHQLPGKTLIRSVAVDSGRIFTGSFEEFGFWSNDNSDELSYTSLVPLLKDYTLHNDEIWKIVRHGGLVYFQSFGAVLMYDFKTIKPLKLPGLVLFLLEAGGHLYVQQINGGLYEIIGSDLVPIPGSEIFSSTEIKAIIQYNNNDLLIGTSSKGIYRYDGRSFEKWENEASAELIESKINNGLRIGNKLVFGTILNGIYILDLTGKLLCHLNNRSSLQNNTILALENDKDDNLWAGMDKGIDYIECNSPIEIHKEPWTSYNACIFNGELYVATNQGLYYYHIDENGTLTDKQLLNGSQGQVWFVKTIDNELYCGLNDGTYLVRDHKLTSICPVSGGYNLAKVISREREYMIQSTYSSIVIYSKENQTWRMSHILEGFMAPARYLETDFVGNLWLGHSIKGVFMIQPSEKLDSVAFVKKIGVNENLPENANRVFLVDNKILVPTGEKLYRWNDVTGKMIPDEELNAQLDGFESSNTIVQLPGSRYWFIRKNECGMFEIRQGKAKHLYRLLPEMYNLNLVENNENIVVLNDSLHLICLDNGFALLNIFRLNQLKEVNRPPLFRNISFIRNNGHLKRIDVATDQKAQIPNSHNTLFVSFSSDEPAGKRKYYQYMLEGLDKGWSEWASSSEVTYSRLPAGNYLLRVRTLNSKGLVTQPAILPFRIKPPWFISITAYICYSALFICSLILLRAYFRKRLLRHRELLIKREQEKTRLEKEKAEQKIIRLSHENLQAEISHKNSQLANSTMSIIKKNELLIEIDDELENLKAELGYRMPNKYYDRLKRLINQNIENEHDWEMFERLFDQAHENFFKRLKSEYPSLTPSDLRLCAYLRMNLSSKEIAPLINITVRGVEERRYRLRKRLNLPADQNLTDYILAF